MSGFKAKMHQNPISAGALPVPAGRAYSAPPDHLAGFKGPTSKGRKVETWIRRDGSGRKGRGGTGVLWSPKTSLKYTLVKGAIPHRDAKSAVYDCLVPFDDENMKTSLYK